MDTWWDMSGIYMDLPSGNQTWQCDSPCKRMFIAGNIIYGESSSKPCLIIKQVRPWTALNELKMILG